MKHESQLFFRIHILFGAFQRCSTTAAKNLIIQVSLPSADGILDALNVFQTELTWPETQQRIQVLL